MIQIRSSRQAKSFLAALFACPCLIILCAVQIPVYDQPRAKDSITWTLGSSTSLIRELSPEILYEVKQSGIDLIEIGWRDLNWHELDYEKRLANARRAYTQARDVGISIW